MLATDRLKLASDEKSTVHGKVHGKELFTTFSTTKFLRVVLYTESR